MLAPRRRPPCFTTSVVVSKMRMKPTGPEATRPVLRTWSPRGRRWRETEAGAAPGLVDQGHVPHPLQDAAHVVVDRDDEAGGQLAPGQAGVHQGGGVGQEFQGGHGLVKGLGLPGRRLGAAVAGLRRGHAPGHPPEELVRGLHHPAVGVPAQIALLQDPEGDGAKGGLGFG